MFNDECDKCAQTLILKTVTGNTNRETKCAAGPLLKQIFLNQGAQRFTVTHTQTLSSAFILRYTQLIETHSWDFLCLRDL